MQENSSDSGVWWFIAGAAIGASIALIFAPASGEATRKTIAKRTGEGRAALTGSGQEMLDRGSRMFERARQLTEEAAQMFQIGRKIVEDTAANLREG